MRNNTDLQQVFRIDGKNVFCEIMLSGLPLDKVLINFMSYDPSKAEGSRKQAEIGIFMDMYEAEVLARDILSGRISVLGQQELKKAKESNNKYPKHVYEILGGTAGKNRADGVPQARSMQLAPGASQPWILTAKQGPGHETPQGLIVLDKPDQIVRVPLTDENLKKMALAIERVTRIWEYLRFVPVMTEPMQMAQSKRQDAIDKAKADSATAAQKAYVTGGNAGMNDNQQAPANAENPGNGNRNNYGGNSGGNYYGGNVGNNYGSNNGNTSGNGGYAGNGNYRGNGNYSGNGNYAGSRGRYNNR